MMGGYSSDLYWALLMLAQMLAPVLLIILAVTLAAGLWNRFLNKEEMPVSSSEPLLNDGYSGGEITKEEFFS